MAIFQTSCFFNASIKQIDSEVISEPETGIETPISDLAEPQGLNISQLISNQASLGWSSAAQDISQYKIVLSSIKGPDQYCSSVDAITTSNISINLESLSSDTTYYYRVCSLVASKTSKGISGFFKTLKSIPRTSAFNSYSNWNDYLLNDGSKFYNATQTVCPGNTISSDGFNSCINGGLVQKIIIPYAISCDRIKTIDFLSTFQWHCDAGATETVIYSTNLNPRKGLQDLISNYQFKDNYVIVQIDGVNAYASIPEKWWTNTIEELPDSAAGGSISVDNGASPSGKILVVNSSKSGGGYNFTSNKMSLVVMKNVELKKDTNNAVNFISAGAGINYLWFEGKFSGNNTTAKIFALNSSAHNRYTNIELKDVSSKALDLGNSINSIVSDFYIHHCNGAIIGTTVGWGNLIINGTISTCSDPLEYIYYSRVHRVIFSNNPNLINGAVFYKLQGSIVTNLTFVNNTTQYGFRMANTSHNLIHNALSLNSNTSYFVYAFLTSLSTFSQLMSFGSSSWEIAISNTSGDLKFTNNLTIDTAAECNIVNNTANSPGLAVGTCLNHGPYSDSTLNTVTPDYTKFFYGKVTDDDLTNPADNLGSALFSSITDWISFANPFRSWGPDGGTFPSSDNKGPCTSGNCRIWDYRLKADAANIAYNNTNNVVSKNDPFLSENNCPSAVNGNKSTTYVDASAVTYTFLTNAMEIMGDGAGNENTLCESGESCIYTPNFGTYQGEGDFYSQKPCTFQNGTITNVRLYSYPIIGI